MESQTTCRCGSSDHAHLCMLRSSGKHDEISRITTAPKFYCFTCAGEANCAENLCEPAPIG